jgi:hypothetical protein
MAIAKNFITAGLQGQLGKQLVFKRYGNKTVVTKYPDMSGVKPSKEQKDRRKRFAEAVAYARAINNDPVKKAAYAKRLPKGKRVYQFALQEYLKG